MSKEEFRKDFWMEHEFDNDGYSNMYCTIIISDVNKQELEDYLYDMEKDGKMSVMYGFDAGKYIRFDIHKGETYYDGLEISRRFPEASVLSSTDWDEHRVYFFRNGQQSNDFSVRWDNNDPNATHFELSKEPEPYIEDGKTVM